MSKVIPEEEINSADSLWNSFKKIIFCLCAIASVVVCITGGI